MTLMLPPACVMSYGVASSSSSSKSTCNPELDIQLGIQV